MLNLMAWIQNSDKTQEDLILNNGKFVVDQSNIRGEISKKMFDIHNSGDCFHKSKTIDMIRLGPIYFIKLQTLKLDENGRNMPMMMLVEEYQENSNPELKKLIDSTLSNSKYEFDNKLVDEILNQLKKDLENIKKKRLLTVAVGVGIGVLFVVTLTVLIKSLSK